MIKNFLRKNGFSLLLTTISIVCFVFVAPQMQAVHQHLAHADGYNPAVGADLGCSPGVVAPVYYNGTVIKCGPVAGMQTQSVWATTDNTGYYLWTYPAICANGNVPALTAMAVAPSPQAGYTVNVQYEGTPGTTSAAFRVTKSVATSIPLVNAILAVVLQGSSVGVTTINLTCTPQ